tara:strand:- start:1248 stop:1460 length:213 start_codon:yes stop_codon:yes gene_type:complete
MYTVYKVNLDDSLSHKEHLNRDEIITWLYETAYGKFVTIKVVNDLTGNAQILTDNGEDYERVKIIYKGDE